MRQSRAVTKTIAKDPPTRPEPSPDAAEIRGREAFLSGVARESCPFRDGTLQRVRWLEGWDAAQGVRQAIEHRWGREG